MPSRWPLSKKKIGSPYLPAPQPSGADHPQQALIREAVQIFQGPLPPPDALQHYENILPGLAGRIVAMAEQRHELARSQSAHRQDLEKAVITANVRGERLGQILAFLLAGGTIALGGVLAWNGKETSGLVSIVSTLVGLVAVFFAGRRKQSKELQRKREA